MSRRFLAEVVYTIGLVLARTWTYQLQMVIALTYWLVVGPINVVGKIAHTQFLPTLPSTSSTYWYSLTIGDEDVNQ